MSAGGFCLRGAEALGDAQEFEGAPLHGCRGGDEGKRGQSGVGWLDAVERDGGEVLEQGLEAVRWVVVAGPVGVGV